MANLLTREAVLLAVAEYEAIGRDAFLVKYGFGKARDYYLEVDGRHYDSKAIAGAAYGYLPGRTALTSNQLTGGITDAAAKLIELGFTVNERASDPNWTWDEHVLALDLYMQNPASPPGKTSEQVNDVSRILNLIGARDGAMRTAKYRNPTGVYMKMMNFRRHDPDFQAQGKKGLSRGAIGEADVWERFSSDLPGLRAAAQFIRSAISTPLPKADADEIEDMEGAEGSVAVRLHKKRERNGKLIRAKRNLVLKQTGKLSCEVCAFDFANAFGGHGDGFIEVHHTNPLALSQPDRKTKLSELAVVCSNCHRMLHRRGLITLDQLRVLRNGD
jgi:5-methylcytosine-specific restriction protein A